MQCLSRPVRNLGLLVWMAVGAAGAAWAQTSPALRGTITDPSGASVPGALVQLRGPGPELRATTDISGQYAFVSIRPGKYRLRVIAKGFSVTERRDLEITGPLTLDLQLTIQAGTQVVNVEDEANRVSADPASSGAALVLRQKELAALSDDPDELLQQLQAMAGPAAGPNGGQIYIDGFTGGNLPAKSSIQEVRINSNPFSPEYDRPGFGRIEILTKPGSDTIRGQAFFQFNDESLNSRSPLLAQSSRPPYANKFFGFNISGPIKRQKASFGLDFERRNIDENAFILATTLDNNLNPRQVNQGVVTPQRRTNISPRIDYSINPNHRLVVRYQDTRIDLRNQGVGNYGLSSRAYRQTESERTLQATGTSILGAAAINETRFQMMRTETSKLGDNSTPAVNVQGAFEGGGSQVGASGSVSNRWELANISTLTRSGHTVKWGGRLRQSLLDDTSKDNFGGTFSFFGGSGPQLDAASQPIAGTALQLTALERYRRTLLFQQMGYSAALIRSLGGGASQFSMNAGLPLTSVGQFDLGLFANDDWRIRPNLTLSYGLRYETQTNIRDLTNFSPRLSIAWGIGGRGTAGAKTVIRAGSGIYYDRVAESITLQAERYNGTTQQAYLVQDPDFYPTIPRAESLANSRLPQRVQIVDSRIRAPRTYQASAGVDRQINRYARVSAQYMWNRGVRLQRSRNINAPRGGAYPFGDPEVRMLTETTGFSRSNTLIISPSINYKKLFLFGFYALSQGMTDAEGIAADPYNLRAEWGPSSFADVRHRFVVGASLPMPWKLSLNPFVMASSGSPYNITTGRDTNGDSFTTERPALLPDMTSASCRGGNLVWAPSFGCFDLNPGPGVATITRNYARGPANANLSLRLARTWSFGNRGESGPGDFSPPPGMGGVGGGGPPAGGPPGGGAPPGGGPGGGPPAGLFGASSGKKYNLTLSISARNVFNHANYAAPGGDLSSPFFGQYRSLGGFGPFGGSSTYNRKIDLQLRFMF